MDKYIAKKEEELYTFLRNNVSGSKNNIKSFLTHELVSVNGKTVTKYNYLLKENDEVTIGAHKVESFLGNVKILYEDNNILVVDKPSGMLTIATEEEKDKTNNLFSVLQKYVKKKNSNCKLYVVHRLDKDTSGVILFSKNEKLMELLQRDWNEITTRIYYAVVKGVTKDREALKSFLNENDNLVTYTSNKGKLAITEYQRIKNNKDYSLLKINIKTGRRNQIRVQLKEIGHPIVGDNKYGDIKDDKTRLYLHANRLKMYYPEIKKDILFETTIPSEFKKIMN